MPEKRENVKNKSIVYKGLTLMHSQGTKCFFGKKYNALLAKYKQTITRGFLINKKGAKFKGAKILPEKRENVENKIWKKVA